jgi:RNA polymerase sigma-70 factor (ECF subfamily)
MSFDAAFLTRLKQRDPEACAFLVSSLTPVLEARLRYKLRDHGAIEDIRNETFCRVFCLVDGGRIRRPEQFGSFVRGVCDRVAQESRRTAHAAEPLPGAGMEPPDGQPHLDKLLVEKERRALVWRA